MEENLSIARISDVTALEEKYLTEPSLCFRSSVDDIRKCLASGSSIGYFVDGKLCAYVLAHFTEYGTAYVEKCFVLPECRGRGLQRSLTAKALSALRRHGAHVVYTMVSPGNPISIGNFAACGFMHVWATEILGESRNVMRYEIKDKE